MDRVTMQGLLEELDNNSVHTLVEKNAKYSSADDCLHNFTAGAQIAGGTPAQACWGYLTKHLVALRDMVQRDDFSDRYDFLEKCQDVINYVRFIWLLGNEANELDPDILSPQEYENFINRLNKEFEEEKEINDHE